MRQTQKREQRAAGSGQVAERPQAPDRIGIQQADWRRSRPQKKGRNGSVDNEKQDTRRKNIVAVTLIMVFFTMVSLLITFILISEAVQERSLGRMEEGIQEVTEEIKSKMDRESRILNATADILSKEETLDQDSILELMGNMSPLLETMQIRVLLPDDTVLVPNGTVADVSDRDELSFDVEAPLGEHVTDRVTSLANGRQVLRYFVPVIRDGETAALVFGLRTYLKSNRNNSFTL